MSARWTTPGGGCNDCRNYHQPPNSGGTPPWWVCALRLPFVRDSGDCVSFTPPLWAVHRDDREDPNSGVAR